MQLCSAADASTSRGPDSRSGARQLCCPVTMWLARSNILQSSSLHCTPPHFTALHFVFTTLPSTVAISHLREGDPSWTLQAGQQAADHHLRGAEEG